MNFTEHAAKPLLRAAGLATPEGRLATTPEQAAEAARALGRCVVKAQVPAGKRGKAGGIKLADDPEQARAHAAAILGMEIGGHRVESLLVERQVPIRRELYAAVLNDPSSKSPMVMFSAVGGMDIEQIAAERPDALRRASVDVRAGFDPKAARALVAGMDLQGCEDAAADALVKLYRAYRDNDAELMEVNPLCVVAGGELVALDCKFVLDDSACGRQPALAERGTAPRLTELELRAQALGLKYIALDGDIGVLANGAGLTMTTMDVITHLGGAAANFLEIGGESYTKATAALGLVLDNPKARSVVVNFCGAFARTDVMTAGVIDAVEALKPSLPMFFCIHGTGATEAREMLRARLGVEAYPTMDAAIEAAIDARH